MNLTLYKFVLIFHKIMTENREKQQFLIKIQNADNTIQNMRAIVIRKQMPNVKRIYTYTKPSSKDGITHEYKHKMSCNDSAQCVCMCMSVLR